MTGVIEYLNDKPNHFGFVRDGVKGNYEVIWRMIDIVRDTTLLDKGFEDFVKQTTHAHGFDSYSDPTSLFEFWFNLIKRGGAELHNGIAYISDIQGKTESIKDARTTLQDGYGDCDDHAILMASVLAVLGYSPCFVVAKYDNDSEGFEHVYTIANVNGVRYVFDTSLPDGKLNDEAPSVAKDEICVFTERPETDGIQSIFRNLRNVVHQTQHNAKMAAPFLAHFAPFGLIGNTMLSAMFSGATDKNPISLSELGSEISSAITDVTIQLQNGKVTQSWAYGTARKQLSRLYAEFGDQSTTDAFTEIEKRLQKKVDYIANYGAVTDSNSSFITDNLPYIKIGLIGFGLIYFLKKL